MGKNIYSVTDITLYLKRLISEDFMCSAVSIRGELSNVKYHSSGHLYFTLKDAGAALSCIMFSSDRRSLGFRMEDGQKVVCSGRISVFEQAGRYQLYVKAAELSGSGELYAEYERIKKELEEMGMFDPVYKQQIPTLVRRVGVVTSPTGAARRDIEQIARRRNPYAQIILYPALVQGEGAVASIVRGIGILEKQGVDVMIVGRGGGSIEDLWAFNSPEVAQAVFDCSIPVISAVGHETDTTIIDFVADLRAPTPSAAAELAVCDVFALMDSLREKREHLMSLMEQKLSLQRLKVDRLRLSLIKASPANTLEKRRMKLQKERDTMQRIMTQRISDQRMQLLYDEEKLQGRMEQRLKEARSLLAVSSSRMEGLSPLKRLSAGYSYLQSADGRGIRSVKGVKEGDSLLITLKDGNIEACARSVSVLTPGDGKEEGVLC